jgi:hypothetical protein
MGRVNLGIHLMQESMFCRVDPLSTALSNNSYGLLHDAYCKIIPRNPSQSLYAYPYPLQFFQTRT